MEVEFVLQDWGEDEKAIYVTASLRLVRDSFAAHNQLGYLQSYDASYLECTSILAVYECGKQVDLTTRQSEYIQDYAIQQGQGLVD